LPLLQGIIAMFIIMVLPVLLLFSCYSVEKTASIVITFFDVLMLPAIWYVIGWIDNVLLVTLWPQTDLVDEFTNFFSISRAAFNFIVLSSYIIFTYLWIGLVQSIGGGLSHALNSTMSTASNGAGVGAEKGFQMSKAPVKGQRLVLEEPM